MPGVSVEMLNSSEWNSRQETKRVLCRPPQAGQYRTPEALAPVDDVTLLQLWNKLSDLMICASASCTMVCVTDPTSAPGRSTTRRTGVQHFQRWFVVEVTLTRGALRDPGLSSGTALRFGERGSDEDSRVNVGRMANGHGLDRKGRIIPSP